MNFADEFNPEQQNNPFNPHSYNKVADCIELLTPETIAKLGWDNEDDLWDAVNQAFSLYEGQPGADEIQ
jgi:hypothetical protein